MQRIWHEYGVKPSTTHRLLQLVQLHSLEILVIAYDKGYGSAHLGASLAAWKRQSTIGYGTSKDYLHLEPQ